MAANLSDTQKMQITNHLLGSGMTPDEGREILRRPDLTRGMVEALRREIAGGVGWGVGGVSREGPTVLYLGESGDELPGDAVLLTNVPMTIDIDRTVDIDDLRAKLNLKGLGPDVRALLEKQRKALESHPREQDVRVTSFEGGVGKTAQEAYNSTIQAKQTPVDGFALLAIAQSFERLRAERFLVALWGAESFKSVLVLGNMVTGLTMMSIPVGSKLPGKIRIPIRTPPQ